MHCVSRSVTPWGLDGGENCIHSFEFLMIRRPWGLIAVACDSIYRGLPRWLVPWGILDIWNLEKAI
jgi:hypothetical protein